MKLTKLQRYTAYIIMLQHYKSLKDDTPSDWCKDVLFPYGLCYVVYDVFGLTDSTGSIAAVISQYLPELQERVYDFEFSETKEGKKQRIAALESCIEETHP